MSIQDYELNAWLGDQWTPEQAQRITSDFRTWQSDHPDTGPEDTEAMLVAICQYHDNTLDFAELAEADRRAQLRAAEARRSLKAATVVRWLLAEVSEAAAAREAGVDRMTMRKWLGK